MLPSCLFYAGVVKASQTLEMKALIFTDAFEIKFIPKSFNWKYIVNSHHLFIKKLCQTFKEGRFNYIYHFKISA